MAHILVNSLPKIGINDTALLRLAAKVPPAQEAKILELTPGQIPDALQKYALAPTPAPAAQPAIAPVATAAPATIGAAPSPRVVTPKPQPAATPAAASVTVTGFRRFLPQFNWGEGLVMPAINMTWLNWLLANFGLLGLGIIALPLFVQAFAPEFANQFDFGWIAGPKSAGPWTWQIKEVVNLRFYQNLLSNITLASVVIQFVTVLQILVSISAGLDALSNVTGRDWSGIVGQLLVLPALAAPSPLLQASIMLVACWSMSRDKNARRAGLHWLLLAVFVAISVYLMGSNYKHMGNQGVEGLLKASFAALSNLNALGGFVVTYSVIGWFTIQAFRFEHDGSSQAWLHLLLATLALLSGSIPFAPEIRGQWQTISWTAVQNPVWLYENGNLLIAIILFFQEQVKISSVDSKTQKRSYVSHWAPIAVTIGNIAAQLWIASLIRSVYDLSFLMSWLLGMIIVNIPIGMLLFGLYQTVPSLKQALTSGLNTVLGDHTMAGPFLFLNDQFNLVAAGLMILVLNVPQFAALIGLVK